jgi:NADH:ubiquinone oxidoreductase subunit E
MTINRRVFGRLTQEKIDRILTRLKNQAQFTETE